jgi:hypothetical protein
VRIPHYHADNGLFADNLFTKAIDQVGQTSSYCGVNAHWQNGKAERHIRLLRETARTMMIHANRQWPSAITSNLWPYAVRMANDIHNVTPGLQGQASPYEQFSGIPVQVNPQHCHHFGYPAYELDKDLSAGKHINKWTERAKMGHIPDSCPVHWTGPEPHHGFGVAGLSRRL